MTSVKVEIGNTYQLLHKNDAKLDQTGKHKKVHDWTVFVNVLKGYDTKLIHKVLFNFGASFSPRTFGHTLPPFQSRQQSYGLSAVDITIITADHQHHKVTYQISNIVVNDRLPSIIKEFHLTGSLQPLLKMKLPDVNFGVELELTSSQSLEAIARQIHADTNETVVVKDDNYKKTLGAWKIVSDASVRCPPKQPGCATFELVSPILRGEQDLERLRKILEVLNGKCQVSTNKSAGFHVHVEVGSDVGTVQRMCQNFVKYERAMDSFMPASRRNNQYCLPVGNRSLTNKENNDRIAAATTLKDIADIVNPNGSRYHKINLQNLISERQPTVEFRQHSGTSDGEKVDAWVRFVVAFMWNSRRFTSPPKSLKGDTELEREFEVLFQWLIKDRYLLEFYQARVAQIGGARGEADGVSGGDAAVDEALRSCCSACPEQSDPCRSGGS